MDKTKKERAFQLFLMLSGVFVASLVACNLIFKKFFSYYQSADTDINMVVSVGIIAYPITFLVTDLISELYGRKLANQVVCSGVIVSLFVLVLITISDQLSAVSFSPVDDGLFHQVFGNSGAAITSSMIAYLIAQFIDVRIFHFWKKLTNGKMLWLRNNFSTIPSQLIDTAVVLLVLCQAGEIGRENFWPFLGAGFLFKVIVAVLDTPILYGLVYWARRYFGLKENEEISLY